MQKEAPSPYVFYPHDSEVASHAATFIEIVFEGLASGRGDGTTVEHPTARAGATLIIIDGPIAVPWGAMRWGSTSGGPTYARRW
jgi:hypothetical protein